MANIHEVGAAAEILIEAGALVFFKFTCHSCLARQHFEEPNTLYVQGRCEECGYITNLLESEELGYTVMFALDG